MIRDPGFVNSNPESRINEYRDNDPNRPPKTPPKKLQRDYALAICSCKASFDERGHGFLKPRKNSSSPAIRIVDCYFLFVVRT